MEKTKVISLIIPAYKQEKDIEHNIAVFKKALEKLHIPFEIIIVVDGIVDKTYENAQKKVYATVKIFAYKKNRGKGYAVKYGVLRASGDIIGFIDAGFDIDTLSVPHIIKLFIEKDADIVIGSKLHPESQVNYPAVRRILSWGYRGLTKTLFGLTVNDTQVGLKFFRREVAEAVIPRLLVKAFAFDIEFLAVAHDFGFSKIVEGPIKLHFNDKSSITSKNFWRVVSLMIWDTFAVFYRLKILRYYRKSKSIKLI